MEDSKLNPFVRIRGVKGRGAEIIKELERRGGKNGLKFDGEDTNAWYCISQYGDISEISDFGAEYFLLANYEEITLPRWRAGECESYFSVSGEGMVVELKDYRGITSDLRYAIGNYARTKEELEPYAEKVKELFKDRLNG